MDNKINIILNGKNVQGLKGESVLQLCRRLGIEIPTLCHDDRLEPFSSCYLCVVEIKQMRGLQPACSTKIFDGMDILTTSDKINHSRKGALDLLLSNHYADCVAPCKQTCPAGVDVQGYISLIEKGLYSEAIKLIKEVNPLPAICGRVCVRPCEVACRRNLLDEGTGVGIDYMKRFAADVDLYSEGKYVPEIAPSTGKKVAIIGAGPGGLSAAYFLQQKGHQCDIYEAAPNPGGWLRYGIPEYRLPNDLLDKEVECITEIGANIYYNQKLGDNLHYKDLKRAYDSVILTIGSQKGTLIGCEGDDAENVFSGIDFLKNMEMTGQRYDFTGKKVIVVGGGNTAMDCCRTSLRCGSTDVKVIYRRTEKEMPANPIEIHESKLEGVEYLLLTNPTLVNKDDKGVLKSVTCLKMELGEPDASGRRRPVPVEGSEFELEVDYILAAIGQKTQADFLDDINSCLDKLNEEVKVNRWGDLDCDRTTLQTGVKSIFGAGDGVSGPATIIEAIAQAKIASRSCHQFLMGEELTPEKAEFISTKDNYKPQVHDEYVGRFARQMREEMPTMDTNDRVNFKEVELGYDGESIAKAETARCLECGCTEYFTCDLKRYATEYGADQQKFKGEFGDYEVDFRHPYIEIDNNKCVLCSRCVRICSEVVGANALGLVERGFDTYVAPSMGSCLQDTSCESCGLCISTCPTGAITENVNFKPGPVKLEKVETICNYCSLGCEIELHHQSGYVMKTTGKQGLINYSGNLCKYPKFGYEYYNKEDRITKPLLKVNGKFEEISFEKAYDLVYDKIKSVSADENAFFGGARLTNEELYLIQKLARLGAKTNNVNSFHYMHGGNGYLSTSLANAPFAEMRGASKLYILGAELNADNAIAGFKVNNIKTQKGIPVELITCQEISSMEHKVDEVHKVKSYYHLIKAMNFHLLNKGLENKFFIDGNCTGFEEYKEKLLAEDYQNMIVESGVKDQKHLEALAEAYNKEMNAIILYSEKELTPHACYELFNLAMITGKLNKSSNGLIALKEKNNSHGLLDMGVNSDLGVGGVSIDDDQLINKMKESWKVDDIPVEHNKRSEELLNNAAIKNMFIFGEDPVGCAIDKNNIGKWFNNADFVMVQDYFLSETAQKADLILPASFPTESGGSFTNTQKYIQEFKPVFKAKVEALNHEQLIALLDKFNSNGLKDIDDVASEAFSLLKQENNDEQYAFYFTDGEKPVERLFKHGCDLLVKMFDENFEKEMSE
ncbi:MAG: FAD-dependent oxidoreductase [Bacteroidetes bacterium]|nr:FAD-dependent oxidoreductase [Bacteroidota bacterium]